MSLQWDVIGSEGFKFMGKMNASISHEIKNVLAIINENAGLLEDFTVMAEKGQPLDPERLKRVAGKIQHQVRRADRIIRNMNTFAHSVDEVRKKVDLGEVVAFMAALSERLAAMKGVVLEVTPPSRPVAITTNPFLVENIIWRCLDFGMTAAGPGKTVVLTVDKDDQGARIIFSQLEGLSDARSPARFPMGLENALSESMGAQIVVNEGAGEIVLGLPEDID
jgi:signal transduction histidine kinase